MTKKEKVDFVLDMVSEMRANGVPIHGVGMQGHWMLDCRLYPTLVHYAPLQMPVYQSALQSWIFRFCLMPLA